MVAAITRYAGAFAAMLLVVLLMRQYLQWQAVQEFRCGTLVLDAKKSVAWTCERESGCDGDSVECKDFMKSAGKACRNTKAGEKRLECMRQKLADAVFPTGRNGGETSVAPLLPLSGPGAVAVLVFGTAIGIVIRRARSARELDAGSLAAVELATPIAP
mmetsp:Transcript_97802/g.273792  ORF Transcript_97802/g.273792 Transcript_97802/m.273792 type:complete len:159 (+) Transcript_97802:91-567(+)